MMRSDTRSRPLAVALKLSSAEQDLAAGRLTHALQSFAYVEDELATHPERGPEDPVLLRAMIQTAQYGVAATLLAMRRTGEATRAAQKALEQSFEWQEGDPRDNRRYFLRILSIAETREDFARAWGELLKH